MHTEEAAVQKEKQRLKTNFDDEVANVAQYYVHRGVTPETANKIAQELMAKQPLQTVVRTKYDLS